MGLRKYMSKKADNLGTLAAGLSGGIMGGQFPNLVIQYKQSLGGAINELGNLTAEWHDRAIRFGYDGIAGLVGRYKGNTDAAVVEEGSTIENTVERLSNLKESSEAISEAGFWQKPIEFARNIDSEILNETLSNYEATIPIEPTGMAYLAVGAMTAYLLYETAKIGVKRFAKKTKSNVGSKIKDSFKKLKRG